MSIEEARTLAFTSMVAFEWFMAFSARSDEHMVFSLGVLKNTWLILGVGAAIALQAAVLYVPPLQQAFGTIGLSLVGWGIAFAAGGTLFIVEEVRKMIWPRLFMLGKWRPVKSA
jgi:Ca2+-transporting ATPase